MQKLTLFLLLITYSLSSAQQKTEINNILEQWHKAAADANFDAYFGLMTKDAIFIGTDPTENWTNADFKAFSKPYFDKGKAWGFSTLERNIFAENDMSIAWFDELLDTQMGICRGSGVVQKTNQGWKIKHYVLSIAIPNENVKEITELKKTFDTDLMKKLRVKSN
ncbi:nuclear transport factor 2 family protein [Aquimarina algiphila]|uniref:Nuclear transport factor 2 family protein n=1 Tax=Aquimarina algiphila TaxID=2047982 RepID=A0A554VG86_9FLAO|nr:nuclear transport factor 2 family protein [Aquimarina algiphila]TSE06370.1 nuclear transport factor 2 family protein [Aquimarina algiphila]